MAIDSNEDRLDKQLATLRDLPGRNELTVTVLHVHEEVNVPADEAGSSVIEAINEDIKSLQGIPDTVSRASEELDNLGIPTDIAAVRGDPVNVITKAAENSEADTILVAARKRSPVGKAVFGSVTQGVILEGDCSVTVAK